MIDARGMIHRFVDLSKAKTAKQTGILYGSQIMAMAVGLIIAPILTRTLGPEKYGILTFILAVVAFISLFFEFGFFSAGARLLALSKDKKNDQELIGAIILITTGISLSFFFVIFILSFFIDSIFHTSAGGILRSISILAAILPFQYMLQEICQGANAIKKMAIANVVPKFWYLVGLLVVISFFKLNVIIVLTLNLAGIIITVGLIIRSLKPGFSNLKRNLGIILKERKEYGIHIYIGKAIGTSAYNTDKIFISYFVNTVSVGFYNLAMLLTSPMALFSQALSTSLFKEFASKDKIPRKVISFNLLWLLACVVGLSLLGKFIVIILFSDKYSPVVPLILPLALAGFFQGMYQPYNMFLGAHRKGEWLRNMAIVFACTNLILNFVLIQVWGAMGAAIATLASCILWYILCIRYYNKLLKEERLRTYD